MSATLDDLVSMTGVPGVIIADLAMIAAVTGQTTMVDHVTEVTTVGITGTDVIDRTTDEAGTTVTDEDHDRTDLNVAEIGIGRGGDHQMTGEGGKMTTGDVGKRQNAGKLREGEVLVLRGEGGEIRTGIDGEPLRRRGAGQRPGEGMRKTDAGHNYANKLKLILQKPRQEVREELMLRDQGRYKLPPPSHYNINPQMNQNYRLTLHVASCVVNVHYSVIGVIIRKFYGETNMMGTK